MKYDKKVSVIMGVYNQWNRDALWRAVESILNQTLKDFEFIIYDDGSDKDAARYIAEIAETDSRIVLIGAESNNGLAFSLNACIDRAKGEYIARMDADDISEPTRLEEQVKFLEENHEYSWCGCCAKLFDDNGVWGVRNMPERPAEADYLRYSPYIHPTVMYRADVFEVNGSYEASKETLRCEDYEIFMRLRQHGYFGYNLQKVLFRYREDNDSFKRRKFKYRVNEAKIRYRNFKEMKMLWPKGWLYVARPIVGGLVPAKLLAKIKRNEFEYKDNE